MAVVDPQEDSLTVELEATGEIIRNITEYRISTSFLIPTDAWSFTVYNDDDPASLRTKFRPLQPVKLSINGQQQVLGRIEKIKGVGDSGTALEVSGYDYLKDLVAGTVDPSIQVKKEMDLGQALLTIFEPYGIDTIFGDFNLTRNLITGAARAFKGKASREFKKARPDELRPRDNQGSWEFAEEICGRLGFCLQPAGTRNAIVCCVPHDLADPLFDITRPGNVMSASAERDWESVPTVTIARGRGGDPNTTIAPTRHEFATFESDTVNPITKVPEIQRIITSDDSLIVVKETRFNPKKKDNTVYGYSPPVYRPLFYQDRYSKNQEQTEYGVRKMVAEKLRKTLTYDCTVRGHVDSRTGAIWSIDCIANVKDAIEQVNERLWIYENEKFNSGQGPMTSMKLMRPDSYIL